MSKREDVFIANRKIEVELIKASFHNADYYFLIDETISRVKMMIEARNE